eukprot:3318239-Amphidinium_carterae.1
MVGLRIAFYTMSTTPLHTVSLTRLPHARVTVESTIYWFIGVLYNSVVIAVWAYNAEFEVLAESPCVLP